MYILPPITQGIMLANVLVFLLGPTLGSDLVSVFALWPLGPQFQLWQVLTYAFLEDYATNPTHPSTRQDFCRTVWCAGIERGVKFLRRSKMSLVPTERAPPSYSHNVQLLRLLGLAVMVGILGALAVLAFHQLLLALETALYGSNQGLVADARHLPPKIRIVIPALGGLVAGLLLRYFLGNGKAEAAAD